MKTLQPLLYALIVIGLTSCFKRPDYEPAPFTSEVVFAADISPYTTRVTPDGSGWAAGDLIGVYMLDAATGEVSDGAANIRYTCSLDDDQNATFSSPAALTYPQADAPARFAAYYPYTTAVIGTEYPVHLADQSAGTAAHDLMYAFTETSYSVEDEGEVPLAFRHQLAKLVFKFVNVNNETVYARNVSISGMPTTARFNLQEGTFSNPSDITRIWTHENLTDAEYEALVMPCTIDETQTLTCYAEQESFTWNFTRTSGNLAGLEAGCIYTITIPLDTESDGIADVDVNQGTTGKPWTAGGTTNGVAGTLPYKLYPAGGNAYPDTELILTFNADTPTPTVGTSGSIRIYRMADNALVDSINLADPPVNIGNTPLNTQMDIIGQTAKGYGTDSRRVVNYRPLRIDGQKAIIKPHSNKLKPDTEYYVMMDREVIAQRDFAGIRGKGQWTFKTRPAISLPTDDAHTVTAGHDGTADFYSVQGAIDYLVSHFDIAEPKRVYIHNGTYEELLFVAETRMLTLEGESKGGVTVQYNNNDAFNGGAGDAERNITEAAAPGTVIARSGGRSVFLTQGTEQVFLKNLVIKNTSGNHGQAEALSLRYGAATKCVGCEFHGFQDTLFLGDSYCFFYNCLVTGAVDFLWGTPHVALFEQCELRMVGGGEMVQPRSPEGEPGFVLLNCRLTTPYATPSYHTGLVRTFGGTGLLAVVRCTMQDSFFEGGWGTDIPHPASGATSGFRHYRNVDFNGAEREIAHSENAHALTDEEFHARYASRHLLLNAYDGNGGAWFSEGIE